MYEDTQSEIERTFRTVLRVLNRGKVEESDKAELREEFEDIWDDLQMLGSEAAYTAHITNYIADEHERYHDSDDGEEEREKPLCGCSSPTCALKRGELLPGARVHQGGVLEYQTPKEAVANEIQEHRQPYVLMEADRDWRQRTSEPMQRLFEIREHASEIHRKYDTHLSDVTA